MAGWLARVIEFDPDTSRYNCPMEPDEIRAEIERRRRRAKDLKLRETVWALYYWHFRRYEEAMTKDPQFIYPEVVKGTLKFSGTNIEFTIGTTVYQFVSLLSKLAGVELRKWWKLGHFLVAVRGCGLRLLFCCPSGVTRKAGFARRCGRVGAGVERVDRSRRTNRDRRTVAGAAERRDWTGSSRSGRAVAGT